MLSNRKELSNAGLLAGKVALTLIVCLLFLLPVFFPCLESGFIRDVKLLGLWGLLAAFFIFICLVFFYCRDLQRVLELIPSSNRVASPRSVWLMFLIPYNFVEDFFIIYHVSKSIKNECESLPLFVKDGGFTVGIGWCIAQIFSILPGTLGLLSGMLALICWLIHWYFIKKIIKGLEGIYGTYDRC